MDENIPVNTDENTAPDEQSTTSSPTSEEVLKDAIAKLSEENKRLLDEMASIRKIYEDSFNRQPTSAPEHDEFDEVCQKILKGER